MNNKKVKNLVVDSGAFILRSPIQVIYLIIYLFMTFSLYSIIIFIIRITAKIYLP